MNTILLALVAGLTTGGISCLTVQGGLLASAVSSAADNTGGGKIFSRWALTGVFIASKIVSHMLLGAALGLAGSNLLLTPKLMGSVQIFAGIFMIVTALRIADVHPVFLYFVITPPRWAYKTLRNSSRIKSVFAPAILGLLSILMPCGVTQVMMTYAVGSGNPVSGALIMGAFVLGTSPLFFALGATVSELLKRKSFTYAAAALVGVMGIASVNGGAALRGSIYTLQNFYTAAITGPGTASKLTAPAAVNGNGQQEVVITVTNRGYSASASTLKSGIPVRLTLRAENVSGCARAFTIPEYDISKVLPVSGEEMVTFTPIRKGRLAYSCSMGMYTGEFIVE